MNPSDKEILTSIFNGEFTPTRPKERQRNNKPESHSTNSQSSTDETQRKRLKRAYPYALFGMSDKYIEFDRFKQRSDSLRLSASSVSAMAGFHPYQNLARLLMDLVYQGHVGRLLLKHDAELLGIQLISDEQALKQIASKAGMDVTKAVQQAINISKGEEKVKSIQDATKIKSDIIDLVNKSNLTIGEKKQLQEATRSGVNTGFGNEHEENALDIYEDECGYAVECRNEDLKCWKFKRDVDGVLSPIGPPESLHQSHTNAHVSNEQPFFFIVGVADGIRDEFYPLTDGTDDDDWDLRKVVVECKHRMKNAFTTPPMYDQIQTAMYCMMYGTSEGEIIQVIRNSDEIKKEGSKITKVMKNSEKNIETIERKQNSSIKTSSGTKEEPIIKSRTTSITIDRISLSDPLMNHGKNWHDTILPRLASFVDAVYNVRRNDDKRYRLIRASALFSSGGDEAPFWEILFHECPWLVDCDTAYCRR